jgi:hypothetical protein
MPATTAARLQAALGTSAGSNAATYFLEPGADFFAALNETGPRVYAMGRWKDLVEKRTYPGSDGYFSLDRDLESVLMANANGAPQKIRAQFHDLQNSHPQEYLPGQFGMIDAGYSATRRELISIQGVARYEDVTPVTTLAVVRPDGTAPTAGSMLATKFLVTGLTLAGGAVEAVAGGSPFSLTFTPGVVEIRDITVLGAPFPVQLRTDAADPDTCVAEIRSGDDVVRYRRYRVADARTSTRVIVLAKRAWQEISCEGDVVHLGNIAAWKHGFLAKVAEDSADVERASYHWEACRKCLEDEREAERGGARVALALDLGSGSSQPIHNLY